MKNFYIISIDGSDIESRTSNSKLFESLLSTIKKESLKSIKFQNINDMEMGMLLDALYGQILGIEKDCQKLGKKVAKIC